MRTFLKILGWFLYVVLMIGTCTLCAACYLMFGEEIYKYLGYVGAISGIGGIYKVFTVK